MQSNPSLGSSSSSCCFPVVSDLYLFTFEWFRSHRCPFVWSSRVSHSTMEIRAIHHLLGDVVTNEGMLALARA